jgi:hypothetical protein
MPNRTPKRGKHERAAALRALTRVKLHLVPGALEQVPTAISEHFDSPWAPVEVFKQQLRPFPTGLLRFWAAQERGHVLIGPQDRDYMPGQQRCGQRMLDGVAHVALADLATANSRPLVLVGRLLDHLLGCRGAADGAWLSDGGGITPRWQEVGQRVQELFALGYGQSEAAQHDPHAYFAEGLAAYCIDRRALNVADPLLERLLHRTVMNEGFWAAEEE